MEDPCTPLSLAFYCQQEEGMEELKHSLLCATLELETTILTAHEELARKDDELRNVKEVLAKAVSERDEAEAKCRGLMLEKLYLQQQQQMTEATAYCSVEDEPRIGDYSSNNCFSSSESDENFTSSPRPTTQELVETTLVLTKPLPEKGKFLQAVMEAGPLLQTLLLAGPLPQWQHPPPQLKSVEIPPVTIYSPRPQLLLLHQDTCTSKNGCFSKKRATVHCEAPDSSTTTTTKYQKAVSSIKIYNPQLDP